MTEYSIEQVLVHEAPMILIDELISYDDNSATCAVNIGEESAFYDTSTQSIPSYICIEYMAQTIAAYAGANDLDNGREKQVGYLLGSRKLNLHTQRFFSGDRLLVHVSRLYLEPTGLGVIECTITKNSRCIAEAKVNVFQPSEVKTSE